MILILTLFNIEKHMENLSVCYHNFRTTFI